tara:strand:+ start:756 stop:1031 length:276 start_codon:yes stop_codon:yes gene_type:complete
MKLSLIQRLTNEFFKLNKKAKRDPRTTAEYVVRARLLRIERIIQKRYGNLYFMTMSNLGNIIVDKDGEKHDMFKLQRKWISKAKLGRRTKH